MSLIGYTGTTGDGCHYAGRVHDDGWRRGELKCNICHSYALAYALRVATALTRWTQRGAA